MKVEAITRAQTRREEPVRPQLAPGMELIGEYRGSGFRETPYIIRRADGRVLQLTRLLYLVTAACDGARDYTAIAEEVGAAYGRRLSAANVAYLVEQKLRPLGVVGDGAPAGDEAEPAAPLALTMRSAVVPPSVVRPLAALLRPLFAPVIVGAAVAWLVAVDVWLFLHHGLRPAVALLVTRPTLLLVVFGLMIASTAFHELGHAAACRYGGARPGAMGVGLYFVWPAFFTDVTDAYRLDRVGRLRTDLGGVYFNALFALGAAAAYFRTGFEPLLLVVAFEQLQILNQLVPWGRFDGYYVLTDLTGVPDILSRLRPVLLSLIPDREVEPRVAELKPWVRGAVTIYVLTLLPAMLLLLGLIARSVPHLVTLARVSVRVQSTRIAEAVARHDLGALTLSVLEILVLLLTLAAVGLTLGRAALAAARLVWRPLRTRRRARRIALAAAAVAAAALGFALSPHANPAAMRPDDRAGARGDRAVRRHPLPPPRRTTTETAHVARAAILGPPAPGTTTVPPPAQPAVGRATAAAPPAPATAASTAAITTATPETTMRTTVAAATRATSPTTAATTTVPPPATTTTTPATTETTAPTTTATTTTTTTTTDTTPTTP